MHGRGMVGLVMGLVMLMAAPAFAGTRTITVTGTVSEAVRITVNGIEATVDASGSFSVEIVLQEGDNTITVTATDAVGNTAEALVQVGLDTIPPVIRITSPTEGQLFGAN